MVTILYTTSSASLLPSIQLTIPWSSKNSIALAYVTYLATSSVSQLHLLFSSSPSGHPSFRLWTSLLPISSHLNSSSSFRRFPSSDLLLIYLTTSAVSQLHLLLFLSGSSRFHPQTFHLFFSPHLQYYNSSSFRRVPQASDPRPLSYLSHHIFSITTSPPPLLLLSLSGPPRFRPLTLLLPISPHLQYHNSTSSFPPPLSISYLSHHIFTPPSPLSVRFHLRTSCLSISPHLQYQNSTSSLHPLSFRYVLAGKRHTNGGRPCEAR